MLRPLRIESPGAIHHITSRDDRREPIFVDDEDQRSMFVVVEHVMARFNAQVLAYCLMGPGVGDDGWQLGPGHVVVERRLLSHQVSMIHTKPHSG
jgi:hypothetical protein